jgi:Leucine-rich repeat (LRR) protein
MRGFLRLPPLSHLRSVDVSGSDVSGCDGLPACPLLERVVLFHTQMAEAPPAAVVMQSVCELFLNNCKLTWLRDSPSLPHLRYLSLADNRYTPSAPASCH